jgi:branched-chain amino acid transport system substrate-binding protein
MTAVIRSSCKFRTNPARRAYEKCSLSFPVFIPKRSAAADMLTIGVTEELTGVYAYPAKNEVRGIQMAVDARNAKGGALGRQIRIVIEDNANNPGTAVEKARKLIQVDQVDALIGTVNSAVSQATSNVAFEAKKPFIDTGGHSDSVTGSGCHWTTFRTCHSTWMETHATGYSLEKKFGKKWYYITPDYAFGHALEAGFNDMQSKLGIQIVGNDLTPLGTTDYSAYLTKVLAAKPDVLIAMVQGDDLINCLKQANSFGLLKRIPVAGPQGELEVFWSLPKEAQVGYWGFEWYYKSDLVFGKKNSGRERLRSRLHGEVQRAADGAKRVRLHHGKPHDGRVRPSEGNRSGQDLPALEDKHFDALCDGSSYYRSVDHQLIWPMWFGDVRAGGTASDPKDIFNVIDAQPGDHIEKSASNSRRSAVSAGRNQPPGGAEAPPGKFV